MSRPSFRPRLDPWLSLAFTEIVVFLAIITYFAWQITHFMTTPG